MDILLKEASCVKAQFLFYFNYNFLKSTLKNDWDISCTRKSDLQYFLNNLLIFLKWMIYINVHLFWKFQNAIPTYYFLFFLHINDVLMESKPYYVQNFYIGFLKKLFRMLFIPEFLFSTFITVVDSDVFIMQEENNMKLSIIWQWKVINDREFYMV